MAEQLLFVPYGENDVFSLYNVFFEFHEDDSWTVDSMAGSSPLIQEKLDDLQEYFERKNAEAKIRGWYQGINIRDNSIRFRKITDSTPSIFLGLFIAAAHKIRQKKIRTSLASVTITGDLEYDRNTGEMKIMGVGKIPEKYGAVKDYAREHPEGDHLFIYVSSNRLLENSLPDNLKIAAFFPDDPIGEILALIFEPQLDDEQQRLFHRVGESLSRPKHYIPTETFERLKIEARDPLWKGCFIHGEGETGKSALALELAYWLSEREYIYAPIWVKLSSPKLQETFNKKGLQMQNDIYERHDPLAENPVASSIAAGIASALRLEWKSEQSLSRLAAAIDRRGGSPYLLVIDNLELDRADEVLTAAKIITRGIKNRMPVIITSRFNEREAGHAWRIGLTNLPQGTLSYSEVLVLVDMIAGDSLGEARYSAVAGDSDFSEFNWQVFTHFGAYPGLIYQIVPLLGRIRISDLANRLSGFASKSLQEKINALYMIIFSQLGSFTRAVLFAFIYSIDPEMPPEDSQTDRKEIAEAILVSGWKNPDGSELQDWEIRERIPEALGELERGHLIYQDEQAGEDRETHYCIKTLAYLTFLFEEPFGRDAQPQTGISLRDTIFYAPLSIIVAGLRHNQPASNLRPYLDRLIQEDEKWDAYALLCIAAAFSSRPEHIDLLLEYGYAPWQKWKRNEEVIGNSLQCAALLNENPEILEKLLDLNVSKLIKNRRAKDEKGNTLLHYAALHNNNPGICALLIDRGSDIYMENNAGWSPFLFAARNPNPEVLRLFIAKGNTVSARSSDGSTLLHSAVLNPNPEALRWLLEEIPKENPEGRLDIHVKNKDGLTPLHRAMMIDNNIEVITALLEHGADSDINEKATVAKQHKFYGFFDDYTPLFLGAIANKTRDNIDFLVKNGADIDAKTMDGTTPLHISAMMSQEPEMIGWLLDNGADIDARTSDGTTPLYSAALSNKNPQIAIALINAGARLDVEIRWTRLYRWKRDTPLKCLKKRKDWSIIEAALKNSIKS